MLRTSTLLRLAVVLALAACTRAPAPPPDTSEADAAAIRQGNGTWIAAWNAGDTAALLMTYTEDAVLMPAGGPAVVGRDAIMQRMTDFFGQFSATQTSTVDEAAVFGDVALGRGTWSIRQTPRAGGAEQARSGKWMVLYQRQADGSWKTWRWMWNEQPAAGQAAE